MKHLDKFNEVYSKIIMEMNGELPELPPKYKAKGSYNPRPSEAEGEKNPDAAVENFEVYFPIEEDHDKEKYIDDVAFVILEYVTRCGHTFAGVAWGEEAANFDEENPVWTVDGENLDREGMLLGVLAEAYNTVYDEDAEHKIIVGTTFDHANTLDQQAANGVENIIITW